MKRLIAMGAGVITALGISLAAPATSHAQYRYRLTTSNPVRGYLAPGVADTYYVTMVGSELAGVRASGNGDLDIRVYDPNGRLVGIDDDPDGFPQIEWIP